MQELHPTNTHRMQVGEKVDRDVLMWLNALTWVKNFINTLEVKEYETKSGIVQKDLQILLDDGMYIDLDPSMQLKPSFSVKEGERVKVAISKEV